MVTDKPFLRHINDSTLYFRIPSFAFPQKKHIDQLIEENTEILKSTPNLIIDLRYNGGGSDVSYKELLPFLYTNPIRTIGMEMRSTELNNQRMLDFAENEDYDEEYREKCRENYQTLSERMGEFVLLEEEAIETLTLEETLPYPQQVAIIINEYCGSTTEEFLLAARQSKKVKLFGTTSFGILDISNMHSVRSPDGEFKLLYSLSRSLRIPDLAIDGIGIKPDYFLDASIPKSQWVQHVRDILNEQ